MKLTNRTLIKMIPSFPTATELVSLTVKSLAVSNADITNKANSDLLNPF